MKKEYLIISADDDMELQSKVNHCLKISPGTIDLVGGPFLLTKKGYVVNQSPVWVCQAVLITTTTPLEKD